MKVRQLIDILDDMPKDAEVWHLWDGKARTKIQHVWLSQDGRVLTSDIDEYIMYERDYYPIEVFKTVYEERTPEEPMK